MNEELKKYIIQLSQSHIDFLVHEIAETSIDTVINYCLKRIDCTRVHNNMRLMQTIGAPYMYEISYLKILIENYVDEDKRQTLFDKVLEIHHNNLEYEKENPPIVYDTKKKSKSRTTKVIKEKVVTEKVPKVSKSEMKFIAKVANIKLTIKK